MKPPKTRPALMKQMDAVLIANRHMETVLTALVVEAGGLIEVDPDLLRLVAPGQLRQTVDFTDRQRPRVRLYLEGANPEGEP